GADGDVAAGWAADTTTKPRPTTAPRRSRPTRRRNRCDTAGRPNVYNPERPPMSLPDVSEIQVRVNYSETDQMGVVYHARYLVWLDMARTEHLREAGFSYKELEDQGIRLVVTDLKIRYAGPARYDDLVRIRCRVREVASRKVVF